MVSVCCLFCSLQVADRLAINFLLFLPAIILGCLGGLLGGLFTHFNIQVRQSVLDSYSCQQIIFHTVHSE